MAQVTALAAEPEGAGNEVEAPGLLLRGWAAGAFLAACEAGGPARRKPNGEFVSERLRATHFIAGKAP
jgi:hypothetical protein